MSEEAACKPFVLHMESLDDDPEATEYATLEAAVDAAEKWFLGGYDNPTISKEPHGLAEDAERLRAELMAGREFYCGNFAERVRITPRG